MSEELWRERIVCDPDLHDGEPCIVGTRVPVSVLVAGLADLSMDQLLAEYPQLTQEDIQAALYFAAELNHGTLVA
jgi:uncharacterized protein (DUF433 family)